MITEPLDPDAIMADHHGEPGGECYGDTYDCGYMWPCPTYRLAAEVKRLRAVEQRVRALTIPPEVNDYGVNPFAILAALDGAGS